MQIKMQNICENQKFSVPLQQILILANVVGRDRRIDRHENPSIGIVRCQETDYAYAEYCVKDYTKPMGVATYKTLDDMPEPLRRALPDMQKAMALIGSHSIQGRHIEVVQYARAKEGFDLYAETDSKTQKKNGYKQVMLLYYQFASETNQWLNFWVKLTVGIKTDRKHIQYAVNKVDIET